MTILPSRRGYKFEYDEIPKGFHFRNNEPIKHAVYGHDLLVVKEQRCKFIKEGYKCSKIMECIY